MAMYLAGGGVMGRSDGGFGGDQELVLKSILSGDVEVLGRKSKGEARTGMSERWECRLMIARRREGVYVRSRRSRWRDT